MSLISDGPPCCHAGSHRRHNGCHTAKPKRGGLVTPSHRKTLAHVYCNHGPFHFSPITNSVVTSETVRQVNNGKGFERHTGLSRRDVSAVAVTAVRSAMFHGDRCPVRPFVGSSLAPTITGNSDPVFSLVMSVSLGGYGDA